MAEAFKVATGQLRESEDARIERLGHGPDDLQNGAQDQQTAISRRGCFGRLYVQGL